VTSEALGRARIEALSAARCPEGREPIGTSFHRDPDLRASMSGAARRRALDFTWGAWRTRVAARLDRWLSP
jgi:hypothetical protein